MKSSAIRLRCAISPEIGTPPAFPVQLVLLIGFFIAGVNVLPVEAAISLESGSTVTLTFNCAEQDQNTPGWPNGCDGLEAGGYQRLPFPC